MKSDKFKVSIQCIQCKSNNVRVIKDMELGMDDWLNPSGDVIIKCLDCDIKEKIILKYEMVM